MSSPLELLALFLIGLSSWLLVSGAFAAAAWELPNSPEGAKLFSYLDVSVQLPNVVPAALVLLMPAGFSARHSAALTAGLLALGVVGSCWLMLAASVRTSSLSVGLLVGGLLGGCLGSTSMCVFFPFAASRHHGHPERSISALSAGIGACGLVAQTLAYISDGGRRIGTRAYFAIALCWQLAGVAGFAALLLMRRGASMADRPPDGAEAADENGGHNPAKPLEHASCSAGEDAGMARGLVRAGDATSSDESVDGGRCRRRAGLGGAASRWAARHALGLRAAGHANLLNVGATCAIEFAMPGLLPYLSPDSAALFWLTALWAVSSIVGRAAAGRRAPRRLWPANVLQCALLIGAVGGASMSVPPPLGLSAPLIALFSALHGGVVTSGFIHSNTTGGAGGTAYLGLANQAGAMIGSLLSLALVSSGVLPSRPT